MGCASSRIDDLPAVELCRYRLGFIRDALNQRYVLGEAHLAYIDSLKSVGVSLQRFFDAAAIDASKAPPSPVLNLPARGKGKPKAEEGGEGPFSPHSSHHLSINSEGGHLSFPSDSDSDLSGSDFPLHYDDDEEPSSSLRHRQQHHIPPSFERSMLENQADFSGSNLNPYPYSNSYFGGVYGSNAYMNFMMKQPTPSLSYQQRLAGAETVQVGLGTGTGNSSSYPYYMANQNISSYYYNNDSYGGYMNFEGVGVGRMGGFSVGPPPAAYESTLRQPGVSSTSSSSKSSPPPPPPPTTSTWDFLNVFENIENSYPSYTPSRGSRNSRELKEEEDIPDLEDEDYQEEVVKEVHGRQRFVDGNSGASTSGASGEKGYYSEGVKVEEVGMNEAEALYRGRPSASPELDPVEFEGHMLDEKIVGEGGGTDARGNMRASKGRGGDFRNISDVVREIQVQFEKASASGDELAKMLEVGKLPYHRKKAAIEVSSKMLRAITLSLPSTSKNSEALSSDLDADKDVGCNHSSTLQKLYLWEKKLFEEVKVEEETRIVHDQKIRRLKRLDERGAESHKIVATQTLVKRLSTKIRMSIQIVDRISIMISRLRDEELWPQLNKLIQGLARMYRSMLECHQNQCQAVEVARGLDAVTIAKNSSDSHLEAILQLEHELLTCTSRFYDWVSAQKDYVKALNLWLFKCINTEPEDTPDGPAPFSPERARAPPIFVICDQWAQSVNRISEKEVLDSMKVFTGMIFQFWERDKWEMRQRMLVSKEMERRVKNIERVDLRIQKEIQALDKKVVVATGDPSSLSFSGNVVYQSDTSGKSSLEAGLLRLFEALNRFTSESLKAYEELLSRSEEYVREYGKGASSK